jgi:hypothetical protein
MHIGAEAFRLKASGLENWQAILVSLFPVLMLQWKRVFMVCYKESKIRKKVFKDLQKINIVIITFKTPPFLP